MEFIIKNLSPNAKTLAVALEDISHPIKDFTHWIIWNIPAADRIKKNIPSGKAENGSVPVVVWEVTAEDEAALDRYEGFPSFYYKKDIKVQYKGIRTGSRRTVVAFAYIMHEDRGIGIPADAYMRTCLEGYDTFCFDKRVLMSAYDKCREICENEER